MSARNLYRLSCVLGFVILVIAVAQAAPVSSFAENSRNADMIREVGGSASS